MVLVPKGAGKTMLCCVNLLHTEIIKIELIVAFDMIHVGAAKKRVSYRKEKGREGVRVPHPETLFR